MSVTADAHNWIHASGPDYQYDAAGNMTYDATASLSYTFDQENRISGANGYTYTYDGDGNRVRKSNGNTAGDGTLYWDMTPGVVAETDLAGTLKSEYVFFDGERVARRDGVNGAGGVFYYFSDHLKTASVITDSAGVIKAESDYYPWGGELQFVNNDTNDYKFTGKKRDIETGLDYFGARYYSSGLGRFVTPDWSSLPVPVPYATFIDPQSLNQYGYTMNNPRTFADADGHSLWETVVKIYQAVKHERELVAVIRNEKTAKRAMGEIREALNTIDKNRYKRVVEVEGNNKAARNAIAARLSEDGTARGLESGRGYPEHKNPGKGQYSDVHVQTEKAAKAVGYLSVIGSVVAPYTQGEAENPGATRSAIISAALWDTAKAIDPVFLTDGLEWMFNLSPVNVQQKGSSGGGGNGSGSGGSTAGGGGGQRSTCITQMSNSPAHPC